MKLLFLSICLLATLLSACGKSNAPPPPAATPTSGPQKTVFDDQLRALERAKAVQATVDQQKKDMDKKLQDQGG